MLPGLMSDLAVHRRLMRGLALILTAAWAATALAVGATYRPGGPLDVLVAVACFAPVLVAAAGIAWPPVAGQSWHRTVVAWLWIAAMLLAIPVLYGVASTLAAGGPQTLIPSWEAAYAGALALLTMALFSAFGVVHARRAVVVFEPRATAWSVAVAVFLTGLVAAAFGLMAYVNDEAVRDTAPTGSRYGPTDPTLLPPFCDEPLKLGTQARLSVTAHALVDEVEVGRADLVGQRSGIDEAWDGSWNGPLGAGQAVYLRLSRRAWLNDTTGDRAAPRSTWQETGPDPFGMVAADALTMDGPPRDRVNVPRGEIVAEDLGLDVIEGAVARHCRTLVDGPTALASFLPLRWLLDGRDVTTDAGDISRWRGQLDWWVFGDGELGRATVDVSGSRADTDWPAPGVQAAMRAELLALDRDRAVDVTADIRSPGAEVTPAASGVDASGATPAAAAASSTPTAGGASQPGGASPAALQSAPP
jgi:hypothetical protein